MQLVLIHTRHYRLTICTAPTQQSTLSTTYETPHPIRKPLRHIPRVCGPHSVRKASAASKQHAAIATQRETRHSLPIPAESRWNKNRQADRRLRKLQHPAPQGHAPQCQRR